MNNIIANSSQYIGVADTVVSTLSGASKKRILVIDDDRSILDVVEEVLGYSGFEVESRLNCEGVFEQIKEFKPDLVLIDYLLSGINGGEFCHQIKTNPLTSHIPVIMMSGYPKVFFSLGNYNCDFFITKPFNLEDLLEKINICLSKGIQKSV